MMSIVKIAGDMGEALYASRLKYSTPIWTIICDKFKSAPDPKPCDVLPGLIHAVTFSDNNELEIKPLEIDDGVSQSHDQLNNLFKKGVVMWLEENGYEPDDVTNTKFTHTDGTSLDKVAFNTLKNHPDNGGLNSFLSGKFVLHFQEKPSSPSPSR